MRERGREGTLRRRVAVSWSTGKDSAWTLHQLRDAPDVEVVALLTTVTERFGRVSVHGTRLEVARAQARACGLPLMEVPIPYPCPNERYEAAMREGLARLRRETDATHVAFGDLFLEDVRAYREQLLEGSGLEPLFPLWGRDTGALAGEMLEGGLEAIIVSAPEDSPVAGEVGQRWRGRRYDADPGVDPCGERGEFHTCVVAVPGLMRLKVAVGPTVRRDGAVYADVTLHARARKEG